MTHSSSIERLPLREQIYEILRERILNGEIAPNECVRDTQVAKHLGASRTPVREALVRLTSEGLLLNYVGRGFHAPPLEAREVEEAHPLMLSLEPLALENSPSCTPARVKQLEALTLRMEKAAGQAVKLNALDDQWHRTLIAGCPNGRLQKYIEELRNTLRRYELAHLSQCEDFNSPLTSTGLSRPPRPLEIENKPSNY